MNEEQLLLPEQFLLDSSPSTTDNAVQSMRMDPRIEVSDHEDDKEFSVHGLKDLVILTLLTIIRVRKRRGDSLIMIGVIVGTAG
jgi:hypothetical protein